MEDLSLNEDLGLRVEEVEDVEFDGIEEYDEDDTERVTLCTVVDEDFGTLEFDFSKTEGVVNIKNDVVEVDDEVFDGLVDAEGYIVAESSAVDKEGNTVNVKKKFKAKRVRKKKKGIESLIGVMREESFGDLLPFVKDTDITDINWNGDQLWLDDVNKGRYLSDVVLTKNFVEGFSIRVSDVVSKNFNKYKPVLEAETDELRLTVLHESVSGTGRAISIRKTPAIKRITYEESIKKGNYCSEEVASLLSNTVKAKMNIIVCGLPGVGKTELVKYLTNYILPRDRAITVEDTFEIRYRKINPDKDCLEMKVTNDFTYTDAIKAALRLLPQWILLSEARSKEVQYLLESVSTGAKCMTTLHTDDVRKIPDRILNMIGEVASNNKDSIENQIYSFFDLGILVDKKQTEDGSIVRFISQVCMFSREGNDNKCIMLVDEGKLTGEKLTDAMLKKYTSKGIKDPYEYQFIN